MRHYTRHNNEPTGNKAKTAVSKHRPVLTAAQISHIVLLCKLEDPLTEMSMSIISYLAPFLSKIENSGVSPAYDLVGRKPAHNSLAGLGVPTGENLLDGMSKEEIWAKSYAKYELDRAACSLAEIQAAREHMYLNDLMTELEVLEFEAASIGKEEGI